MNAETHSTTVLDVYLEHASRVDGAVLWTTNLQNNANHEDADGTTRVLPDGCMDIIWHGDGVMVVGPDTGPHLSTLGADRPLVGLRFAPGVGPAVLGVPAHELRDQRVRLDDVWSSRDARAILDAGNPAAALERVAHRRLQLSPSDFPARPVAHALAGGASVSEVAQRTGWSERHLRRQCLHAFGYGPKSLARILRFDSAVTLARERIPLSDIATRLGYADQAHLSREVKALSGTTLTFLTR